MNFAAVIVLGLLKQRLLEVGCQLVARSQIPEDKTCPHFSERGAGSSTSFLMKWGPVGSNARAVPSSLLQDPLNTQSMQESINLNSHVCACKANKAKESSISPFRVQRVGKGDIEHDLLLGFVSH